MDAFHGEHVLVPMVTVGAEEAVILPREDLDDRPPPEPILQAAAANIIMSAEMGGDPTLPDTPRLAPEDSAAGRAKEVDDSPQGADQSNATVWAGPAPRPAEGSAQPTEQSGELDDESFVMIGLATGPCANEESEA